MNATQCKRRRGKQADHELHHRDANAQGSTSLAVPIELRLTSRWQLQPFPAACLHEEVVLAGAARMEYVGLLVACGVVHVVCRTVATLLNLASISCVSWSRSPLSAGNEDVSGQGSSSQSRHNYLRWSSCISSHHAWKSLRSFRPPNRETGLPKLAPIPEDVFG